MTVRITHILKKIIYCTFLSILVSGLSSCSAPQKIRQNLGELSSTKINQFKQDDSIARIYITLGSTYKKLRKYKPYRRGLVYVDENKKGEIYSGEIIALDLNEEIHTLKWIPASELDQKFTSVIPFEINAKKGSTTYLTLDFYNQTSTSKGALGALLTANFQTVINLPENNDDFKNKSLVANWKN